MYFSKFMPWWQVPLPTHLCSFSTKCRSFHVMSPPWGSEKYIKILNSRRIQVVNFYFFYAKLTRIWGIFLCVSSCSYHTTYNENKCLIYQPQHGNKLVQVNSNTLRNFSFLSILEALVTLRRPHQWVSLGTRKKNAIGPFFFLINWAIFSKSCFIYFLLITFE
jgi:hypothetical protein